MKRPMPAERCQAMTAASMPRALVWENAPSFAPGDMGVQILTGDGYELLAFDCSPPAGAATGKRSIGWELWHGPQRSILIGSGDSTSLRAAKATAVAAMLEHQKHTAAKPVPATEQPS